jgi:DNA-binding response OmpR family regulator
MAASVVRQSDSRGDDRPVVLFVEDNLTHLDLYSLVLEEEFTVVKATRGETGMKLAFRERPDVIVMDALLPDADGLELAHRLRISVHTEHIPIIVLTGDDAAYARAQLARSELSDVFMKPCPADTLSAAIRRAIR